MKDRRFLRITTQTTRPSTTTRLLLAALLVAMLPTAHDVRAQFKDEDDAENDGAAQVQHAGMLINEAQIYQWVFGVNDRVEARSRLESLLTIRLADIDRTCELSHEQKKKLELAGKSDLQRIWQRVEEVARKHANKQAEQEEVTRIFQELQPVQASAHETPFREGTLFDKTQNSILTREQIDRLAKADAERNAYRFRAKVDLVVATLDQAAGFTDSQRQQLRKLILSEVKPPLKTTTSDFQVVMVQLSWIADEKVKPLCDDVQWRIVHPRLRQSAAMEPFLIEQGLIAARQGATAVPDPDAPARPSAR